MTRKYFPVWYRLDRTNGYLIWFSNDEDGLLTHPDGIIPSFANLEALQAYTALHQIVLNETDLWLYDVDKLVRWLQRPLLAAIDCNSVLNFWNLFGDLAKSLHADFDRDRARTNSIYDKLFWGNNLPAVTPKAKHYNPVWSDEERLVIRDVLAEGLSLFRTHVQKQD